MNVKQSIFASPTARARTLVSALACALALALAGCTKIPLSSLWALKGLQFAEVDGAALRALLYLPEGVAIREGGLAVTIKVTRGNGHADERALRLAFTPLQGAAAAHAQAAPRTGGRWLAMGLSAADQQRLADLRREIDTWRAADGPQAKRGVSLGAEIQACQTSANSRPVEDLPVDAWVRWKPGQADLRLLDGAAWADLQPEEQRGPLPRC